MAASTTEPSAQRPTRRLALLYAAIACLIAFAGAAWWSWRYASLPDPFEPAESRTFSQWLTTPIEENAFRRLPVITGNLAGVFALKGTDRVWAVGDGGLIVHSADGGETWEQQPDVDWSPAPPKETTPAAENDGYGLIPSAYAGVEPDILPPDAYSRIQQFLGNFGYDPGPVDGRWGAKTRAAIEHYQRAAGLPVDGKLTASLFWRLQKESAARKAAQPAPGAGKAPPPMPPMPPMPMPSDLALEPGGSGSRGGGLPATKRRSPIRAHLSAVAFANEPLGLVAGGNGVILKTEDGGGRWQAVSSGTTADLQSVAFADGKVAVAVGVSGTLIRSIDGGETWKPTTSVTEAGLSSVAFADAERAVAVGTGGTVLLSTDGGERWEPTMSDAKADLWSVAFADAGRAVAVGFGGTVLSSTDGASAGSRRRAAPGHGFGRSASRTPSGRLR